MSEDNVAQIASRFRAKLRARLDPGRRTVTDVDRLLAEYIAEHRAGGEADPREYLSRASPRRASRARGADRRLPRARPTPAVRRSRRSAARAPSAPSTSSNERSPDRRDCGPRVLPRLRDRAGLKRSALVERLAAALGVEDRQDKVAGYYHEMEQGLLPAEGVSDRVLEALGQIVGETAQALREAGRALAPPGEGPAAAPAAAFARRAYAEAAGAPPPRRPAADEGEWDEVDELFRGG